MYRFVKRLFDIVSSMIGIIVTLPLWLVAIVGIELSDPGPFFYLARRVGKDNHVFLMFKFRSMRQGKANEAVFRGDETRIFPFGRFIRSTKIDELPQLLNVFLGEMSVVGPRPAAIDQADIVRGGKYAIAGTVQAGLTGPSALFDYVYGDRINNPSEYESQVLSVRLNLDLYYIKQMSILFDLKMIFWTVSCIFSSLVKKTPERKLIQLKSWAESV